MTPIDPGIIPTGNNRRAVYRVRSGNAPNLPVVEYPDQGCVLTEWQLTEEERHAIQKGECIRLWIWNRGGAVPVLKMQVTSEHKL